MRFYIFKKTLRKIARSCSTKRENLSDLHVDKDIIACFKIKKQHY